MDSEGQVLATFTDLQRPHHLSSDSEGGVLVADYSNHRILLLNSELQLQHVLVDAESQVELWWPMRLHYDKLTSQLYVLHSSSSEKGSRPNIISLLSLR